MGTYQWKPFTLLVSAEEVKGNEMKIEAGKYYETRDGRKVGPMVWDPKGWFYVDKMLGCWLRNGTADDSRTENDQGNLISEWQDQPSPIRTVTRREIVAGEYGCVEVDVHAYGMSVVVDFSTVRHDAEELREAAHLLNQIAEVLEENGE